MKKLFILLCFTCTTIAITAQSKKEKEKLKKKTDMGLALFLGINYSTLFGDNGSDNTSLLGGHAGLGIKVVDLSDAMGIRSELLYSQQGDKYTYGESTYGGKVISRLNYLNLPVMAHYQSKSGFFAEAGLQPGLLLSAKEKRTSTGMGSSGGTITTDIKKELNSFALGVPLGAGYIFKKKMGVSARVTPGLLNVNKKEGTSTDLKETNFVLSARFSYFL